MKALDLKPKLAEFRTVDERVAAKSGKSHEPIIRKPVFYPVRQLDCSIITTILQAQGPSPSNLQANYQMFWIFVLINVFLPKVTHFLCVAVDSQRSVVSI